MQTETVSFQKEIASECFDEALPLLVEHYKEVYQFKDIPLKPDFIKYKQIEEVGLIRTFTARDNGELIGYAIFVVHNHLHHKSSLQAIQDLLFIKKDKRGFGKDFIAWCDEQLKLEGVQVVMHHVKIEHDFGSLLERNDYKMIERVYARRLYD